MGGLVSKKNKKKAKLSKLQGEDKAILDCKMCRDKIKSYIKSLERNRDAKKAKVKEFVKMKEKTKAKVLLKQVKMLDFQITSAEGQLQMIEDQIHNLDMAVSQRDAMQVLEQGNAALKKLQSEVNVEKMQQISDDLEDAKDANRELEEFFKEHSVEGVSDPDIDADLERLGNEIASEAQVELPDANTEEFKVEEKQKAKQAVEA